MGFPPIIKVLSVLKNSRIHRPAAEGVKEKYYLLPVRGRQWIAFATLQVMIWPEARVVLFNPASHGIEQRILTAFQV
jgi:hypothetical protein